MTKTNFYHGIVAETYDLLFADDDVHDEVEFYRSILAENPGLNLEVACGTGRVTLPLALEGIEIEGFDNSQEMLDLLAAKAEDNDVSLITYQKEMHDFQIDKQYANIILPNASFCNLIDRDAAVESLQCIHEHLQPGGQLIIESFIPHYIGNNQYDSIWRVTKQLNLNSDSQLIISSCEQYDLVEQLLMIKHRYDVFTDGVLQKSQLHDELLQAYGAYEMELLLEQTGFELQATYGNYQFEPVSMEHDIMIFHATKAE